MPSSVCQSLSISFRRGSQPIGNVCNRQALSSHEVNVFVCHHSGPKGNLGRHVDKWSTAWASTHPIVGPAAYRWEDWNAQWDVQVPQPWSSWWNYNFNSTICHQHVINNADTMLLPWKLSLYKSVMDTTKAFGNSSWEDVIAQFPVVSEQMNMLQTRAKRLPKVCMCALTCTHQDVHPSCEVCAAMLQHLS